MQGLCPWERESTRHRDTGQPPGHTVVHHQLTSDLEGSKKEPSTQAVGGWWASMCSQQTWTCEL